AIEPIEVHFFFVNGSACTVTDTIVFLTPNQTFSFLASDIAPGIRGYIIAVAQSLTTHCPRSFNHLIGSAYVKLPSGNADKLGAEAIAALYLGDISTCGATTATLAFDGVTYNRLPRMLALNKIAGPVDNSTLLVVNRIGGDLTGLAPAIGPISGILFDDAENALSFAFLGGCQVKDSLPALISGIAMAIPIGRTGWMKFSATSDFGLFGAAIRLDAS